MSPEETPANAVAIPEWLVKQIHAQYLDDAEKVVLAANLPDYAYGRCGRHGVIARPDKDGSIRAAGVITCPNPDCPAPTVFIAEPAEYFKKDGRPVLTLAEIEARLKQEGISKKDFVRHGQQPAEWLGQVKIVSEVRHEKTKDEWENHTVVFHLPAHSLYLRAHGIKKTIDDSKHGEKKWKYEFSAVQPHEEKIKARTVTRYY